MTVKAGEVFEIAMFAHDALHWFKSGPLPRGVAITAFVIPEAAQRLSGIHTPCRGYLIPGSPLRCAPE
ncbi:MAG: hypothetical protein HY852_11070 [Bradyrhizobium sp.]|uniref:hypothetical protein n=1 Tax=Bradyrhizobium sp. TaxID=376 RepID=UPI0025BB43F6|nr:hypothetical protein [Bradyrhizobium sp.]MBI5262343.1 hypothetical protein [Bradyrhizobium sp.]